MQRVSSRAGAGGRSRNPSIGFLLLLDRLSASPVAPTPAGQLGSPCPVTGAQNWPWPQSRAWEGRQPPAAPGRSGNPLRLTRLQPHLAPVPTSAEASICPAPCGLLWQPALSSGAHIRGAAGTRSHRQLSPGSVTASNVLKLKQGKPVASPPLGTVLAREPSSTPVQASPRLLFPSEWPIWGLLNKDSPCPIPSPSSLQCPIPASDGIGLIYELGAPLGLGTCPFPALLWGARPALLKAVYPLVLLETHPGETCWGLPQPQAAVVRIQERVCQATCSESLFLQRGN